MIPQTNGGPPTPVQTLNLCRELLLRESGHQLSFVEARAHMANLQELERRVEGEAPRQISQPDRRES